MPSGANKKSPAGGGGGKGKKQQQQQDSKNQSLGNKQQNDKTKGPADEDINSGFGEYMRSPQAAEMMKLFVIANTMVVFFTMAWPQMKQSFEIIRSLIYGEDDALKSLFFVTAILGYSTGVWRLISNYFHQEFKTYLDEEVKKNKYLLVDPVVENPPAATTEIITEKELKQAGRSVTANRLLDEIIVNFGRLFTTRNEAEFSRKRTPAETPLESPAEEVSTRTGVRSESIPEPDPGGASAAGTLIENDKFPRSSSSEVDNESDENDVASEGDGDGDGDEEEKWIKYWKHRERGDRAGEDGETGHCEAKLDACGP